MVIFHSYVSLPEGKDCLSKPEESIPVEKLIMGYPKKRMTCIEMEHTKFIEFRQPRSGGSLFINPSNLDTSVSYVKFMVNQRIRFRAVSV